VTITVPPELLPEILPDISSKFHFITDPNALEIIAIILDIAGENFTAPYDSTSQPSDANARNDEMLIQYQVPGGTTMRSTENPASSPGMGYPISNLLTTLGPVIAAYALILPILGIIRGIIEIICCLMNPFCVNKAVVRLFVKWMPPFISLYPPIAGAIITASTIKLIIAIALFVLTEVTPTVELIKENVKKISEAKKAAGGDADDASDGGDDDGTTGGGQNDALVQAGEESLTAMALDLANRTGVTKSAKPLLDIVFLILSLVSGFPCGGGKKSSKSVGSIGFGAPTFDGSIPDSNCCDDDMCPPEIKTPPQGKGLLIPIFYGAAPPLWTWKLIPLTGGENISKLKPYLQDLKSQLNPQLDEEIDEARPVGSKNDAAHFRLRILGRRGEKFCKDDMNDPDQIGSVLVPIARISGDNITITNKVLTKYMGVVNYCIEPNYDQLVGHSILGIGCHPDVVKAKEAIQDRFGDLELSAIEKYPEIADIPDIYTDMTNATSSFLNKLKDVNGDTSLDFIDEIRDDLVNSLFVVITSMTGKMNSLLSKMSDRISSTFGVDKNIAKSGGVDKVFITVTPRDVSGTPIAKNLPNDVDINVDIFTDFGILQNQQRDNSTGNITAELISLFPGTANVMAKVNTDFIMNFDGTNETVKVEQVKFVADAILPKRRFTGTTHEREPGVR